MKISPTRRSLLVPVCRWLGRHTALVGWSGGGLLASGVAALIAWGALQVRVQSIDQGHAQVLQRMHALQDNVRQMLDVLNASHSAECTHDNLSRLRVLLLKNRDLRQIGLLDEQGRLYCSTVSGLLPQPLPRSTQGIDGSVGRYLLKTPLQVFSALAPADLNVTVIERGRFQVVIDDNPTQEVFAQHADGVWAGNVHQRRRAYVGARGDQTDTMATLDTPHVSFDWSQQVWRVTNSVPGVSPISVQSVLVLGDMARRHPWMGVGYVLLCAVLGWLLGAALMRLGRYLSSMEFLIRHLCWPANVVCHYQPILELDTGRVMGCEVLARLQDGQSLLYPDQFIPALTQQQLGWRFDAAVSRHALLELGAALPAQTDFSVALNFFPQNLRRDLILPYLKAALHDSGRSDLRIELEVTEYDFSSALVPELARLKAEGFAISIDDFGTGYSNLGIVKRVAPDYLKIDKSFVFEMADATIRSTLIPEIIAIAKAIGSEVIAEGIETAEQARQLREMGARYGQGYLFAKPMKLDDFLLYLAEQPAPV